MMNRTLITLAIATAVFLLPLEEPLAQVNTESMRKRELTPGLNTSLNLDLVVVAGNSKLTRVQTTLRFDYLKGTAHTFMVGSFQQGRQGEEDSLFINKGFVHLRRTMLLDGKYYLEGFLQKEFNDFIHLEDRNLAGGGLRVRWVEAKDGEKGKGKLSIYNGIGFMWERERIKQEEDSIKNLLRSTNYLVFNWEPDDRLMLQATAYYQVDVRRLHDFRVIFDGGINFTLTGNLATAIKISSRYDNEPPDGIKTYDLELTNGLMYAF